MSKVLFGTLDARNQVDVVLSVTEHMQRTFQTYPLTQPIYHKLSWKGKTKIGESSKSNPSLPNPSSASANTTIVINEPSASISQKIDVTKRTRREPKVLVQHQI